MLGVVRDGERRELRFDERGCVERLFIAGSWSRFVPSPSAMAGQAQRPLLEAALVAEPAQGIEPEFDQFVTFERAAPAEQRLREARIVVAELAFEPLPAVRGVALVAARELLDQALEQVPSRLIEPVCVEARESEHRVCRCSQGDVAGERADETLQ